MPKLADLHYLLVHPTSKLTINNEKTMIIYLASFLSIVKLIQQRK